MSKPFNVKGKGRHYKSPETGQNLPSVTNILDCYPKQHALVHWAANRQKAMDVQAAYELQLRINSGAIAFATAESYKQHLDEYIGRQRAHIKELEKAGEIGSQIHKAIECDMKEILGVPHEPKQELEGAALWAYMAFEDWWKECEIKPIESEIFLFNDEHGYAGTTDLIAEVTINEALLKKVGPKFRSTKLVSSVGAQVVTVIDFKSGKGVYADHLLQLAAYIEAAKRCWDRSLSEIDAWGMIVRLPKTEDDPEFEVRLLHPDDVPQKFETFLAVKKIWEDKHNG